MKRIAYLSLKINYENLNSETMIVTAVPKKKQQKNIMARNNFQKRGCDWGVQGRIIKNRKQLGERYPDKKIFSI